MNRIAIDHDIADWVPSKDGQYLYAISGKTGELLFIHTETWSIENQVNVGSAPADIELGEDGKLYIALSHTPSISVIDTVYGTSLEGRVSSIPLEAPTNRIALGHHKIYYMNGFKIGNGQMDYSQWNSLHEIQFQNGSWGAPRALSGFGNFYSPDMVMNTSGDRLYIGEQRSSGAALYAVNTDTFRIVDQSDSSSYSYVQTAVALDESSVYYAGYRLNQSDLNQVLGTYPLTYDWTDAETIMYVKGDYVFTNQAVYDRNGYKKLFDYHFNVEHVLMKHDQSIYIVQNTRPNHDPDIGGSPSTERRLLKFSSMTNLKHYADTYPVRLQLDLGGDVISKDGTRTFKVLAYDQANASKDVTALAKVWSENDSIAAIEDGVLRGISHGRVTIHASYEGITVREAVWVMNSPSSDDSSPGSGEPVKVPEIRPGPPIAYSFEDLNPLRGKMKPFIKWRTFDDALNKEFSVKFLDSSGNVVEGIDYRIPVKNNGYYSNDYEVEISEAVFPPQASEIVLDVIRLDQAYIHRFIIPMFDNINGELAAPATHADIPAPKLGNRTSFSDHNGLKGIIGGAISLHIDDPNSEQISAYVLYFSDANGRRIQPIAEARRDTPITLPDQTVIPAGATHIAVYGKNIAGEEGRTAAFIPLWDAPYSKPKNMAFEDRDGRRGSMDGRLSWLPTYDESSITGYKYYFQLTDHQMISSDLIPKGKERYEISLSSADIPDNVLYVFLSPINSFNERAEWADFVSIVDNMADEAPVDLPTSSELVSPYPYLFVDVDGKADHIGGHLFIIGAGGVQPDSYELYFTDDNNRIVKPILQTKVQLASMPYRMTIPMGTAIPKGATRIAAAARKGNKVSEYAYVKLEDRTFTTAPQADAITIVNNRVETKDTITVNGVVYGDLVRVYRSSESLYELASGLVPNGQNVISFELDQLGVNAGSVFVTVERLGYHTESLRVRKDYAAEQATPAPPILGGGCCAPPPILTSKPQLTKDAAGRTGITIKPDKDKLLEQIRGGKNNVEVDATWEEAVDRITLELPADIIRKAAEVNKPLSIRSNQVQFMLTSDTLDLQAGSESVQLTARSVPDASMPAYATAASQIFDFSLEIDGKAVEGFKKPIEVTFQVDLAAVKDLKKAFVYYYDELKHKWSYVGGSLHKDGSIKVLLPHFSKYAVLEFNHTFDDIKGHWAQASIERMAARQIVEGMTEESFEPEASVTRAQFVALLTRALKLSSPAEDNSIFIDVSGNAWYKEVVNAAYQAGIATGVEANQFSPDATMTREQMAVMLVNAYRYTKGGQLPATSTPSNIQFPDEASISSWAINEVKLAAQLGMITGGDKGLFAPQMTATRAQAAVVLQRLIDSQ